VGFIFSILSFLSLLLADEDRPCLQTSPVKTKTQTTLETVETWHFWINLACSQHNLCPW
jgi:hypothetical protein